MDRASQRANGTARLLALLVAVLAPAVARAQAVLLPGGADAHATGLRVLMGPSSASTGGYDLFLQTRADVPANAQFAVLFAVDAQAQDPTSVSQHVFDALEDGTRPRLMGCAARQFGCAPTIDAPGGSDESASYKAAVLLGVELLAPSRVQDLNPFFQSAGVQPTEQQRTALDAQARAGRKLLAARLKAGADSTATPVLRITVAAGDVVSAPLALSLLAGPQQDDVSLLLLGVTSHRIAPQAAPVVKLDRSQVNVKSDGTTNYADVAAAAQPPDTLAFVLEFSNILVLDSIRVYSTDPSVQAFFGRGPRFATRLLSHVRRDLLVDDTLGQAPDDLTLGRTIDACHGGPSGCGTAPGAAAAALWPLFALAVALRVRAHLRGKNRSPTAAQIE